MSWSLSVFRRWRPFVSVLSAARIRNAILRNQNSAARNRQFGIYVRSPFRAMVRLREQGSDLNGLEEVVIDEVYRIPAERLPDCRTIVDLGANIGLATIYLASKFPDSRIISVEAHPGSYELLVHNTRDLAKKGRCSPICAAIWSHSGEKVALRGPNPVGFLGYLVSGKPESHDDIISTTISMQDLLSRCDVSFVDLLKIDIEGAEVELLRGDLSWLDRVGAIAIEFHGKSREDSGFDSAMRAHGFRNIAADSHTVFVSR